jgi:hypothetical protein
MTPLGAYSETQSLNVDLQGYGQHLSFQCSRGKGLTDVIALVITHLQKCIYPAIKSWSAGGLTSRDPVQGTGSFYCSSFGCSAPKNLAKNAAWSCFTVKLLYISKCEQFTCACPEKAHQDALPLRNSQSFLTYRRIIWNHLTMGTSMERNSDPKEWSPADGPGIGTWSTLLSTVSCSLWLASYQ